jgi:predicted Zn-ribbon and HTH transcriptional regulator
METLRNFTPTGTNPHKLGFYDSNEDIGWQCWQPEPMCPEKEDFSKTYRDESISHQRQISTDESEEKNDKTYATFYCRKCGYQWTSSKITVEEHVEEGKSPRKCPECNRRTWNKEPEKDKPKAKA